MEIFKRIGCMEWILCLLLPLKDNNFMKDATYFAVTKTAVDYGEYCQNSM